MNEALESRIFQIFIYLYSGGKVRQTSIAEIKFQDDVGRKKGKSTHTSSDGAKMSWKSLRRCSG